LGVEPVQRLNARWNALGAEYPSQNATSAMAIFLSAM
jgi:hypothetical protein